MAVSSDHEGHEEDFGKSRDQELCDKSFDPFAFVTFVSFVFNCFLASALWQEPDPHLRRPSVTNTR